ncbi:hypothetical protein H2204_004002 [Knufia peltigerae]|uniref:Protein kinase domain-containing protein n=1 Tax=Knufia peltigerae TaxID=1002370 RepID=A0AA39D054_9EURO|nr:hypothetical protein H2204_004002 [Knufia peltigerae]
MSSAFFRRPGDESSSPSSSEVESEGSENIDHVSPPVENVDDETGELGTTESFSSHGSISFGDSSAAGGGGPATSFAGVDHHRTNLIDALLEDFARTRACEMMNNAKPGSNYTRSSPEIEALARQFYRQATQSLAQTGVLPTTLVSEQGRNKEQMRATYLAGIEGIALGGVQAGKLISSNVAATTALPSSEEQLAVTRTEQGPSNAFGQLLEQPLRDLSLYQDQNPFTIRPSNFMLSNQSIERPRSHYESSFQQIGLLGKGGFGRVYRTFNVFDKKEYAIKKIPLSPRLSQRYKESGHQELEHVLREVQALAQLEHNNVVRYHATWIESPRLPRMMDLDEERPELRVHGRRLIDNGTPPVTQGQPRKTLPRRLSPDRSDGIVFGSDSVSQIRTLDQQDDKEQPLWSMRQTFSDPSSARPSEIFTDGHAETNGRHDVVVDESVYVLHVQMSVYPLTLEQYLTPAPENARSAPSSPMRRHCFHLVPALRILLGILCGLQYIHAKGLVHRDIKPSNIFISSFEMATPNGGVSGGYYDVGSCVACSFSSRYFVNPRIGDFGLVAELARDGQRKDQQIDGKADKAVGTEYYRPPRWTDSKEKWKASSNVNEKLDVFALGVVLVEMLWHCTTKAERMVVLGSLQKGFLPAGLATKIDKEGHDPGTGELVCQCIAGMINRDPLQRWGCGLVKEQVEEILKQCRVSPNEEHDDASTSIDAGYGVELHQVRSLEADAPSRRQD